jgi:flagellar hook-associated protein 2
MSGITSGVGIFSGIDSRSIIDQLLAVEGRSKTVSQRRAVELKSRQATFLDLKSAMSTLAAAATKFRTDKTFQAAKATSSDTDAVLATARAGATAGTYTFTVDRVVTTQQLLSRGFADRATTAIGATDLIFEPAAARLDRDTPLAELNGGAGIARGKIRITDSAGNEAVVDLSRVSQLSEVIDAINTQSGARVTARVDGNRLVLTDNATGGAGRLTVADVSGYTTATSLGIAGQAGAAGPGASLNGSSILYLSGATTLASLNDRTGVRLNSAAGTSTPDFTITTRDGSTLAIDIGAMYGADGKPTAGPVADIAGVISRINSQSGGKVTASINSAGTGLKLVDNTAGATTFGVTDSSGAAADLRILKSDAGGTGEISGDRVIAALNSSLLSSVAGGDGLGGSSITVTNRAGAGFTVNLDPSGSLTDAIAAISAQTSGTITAELNASGTGLIIRDTTGASASKLTIEGAAAEALGISTGAGGLLTSTFNGSRIQKRYISNATTLASLNNGLGIGTGTFEITDSTGRTQSVGVTENQKTVADLVALINSRGLAVTARVNDNGDGIEIAENPGTNGSVKIAVRDATGVVARSLGLAGEASATGADNKVIGSFEKKVSITAQDTLDSALTKINAARAGVRAAIINDGSGATPFRITFTSESTGSAGEFTVDTGSLDLGLSTLSKGRDARIIFGSGDPATGVLISSASNSFDGVINGVRVDAVAPSDQPVTVTVTQDTDSIESDVDDFVDAFNAIIRKIDAATAYDDQTKRRGPLLGDSTATLLQSALYSAVNSRAAGISGRYQTLSQVGISVGASGQLNLNADRLRTALATDPEAVEELFAARVQAANQSTEIAPGVRVLGNPKDPTFSALGVAEIVGRLADRYTASSTGVFARVDRALQDQVDLADARTKELDDRLQQRRGILERQFLSMEKAIGQLQNQSGSLASIRR